MKRRKRNSRPKHPLKSPGRRKRVRQPNSQVRSKKQDKHPKAPAPSQMRISRLERRRLHALRELRAGKSLAASARSAGISRHRLRRFVIKNRIARRVGKRWLFYKRGRRQMQTFSAGQIWYPTLSPAEAGNNGRYMSAVKQFRKTNDPAHLEPFVGKSVTDIEGKEYPFETRPNVLYRLLAGTEPFEEIYRILTQ